MARVIRFCVLLGVVLLALSCTKYQVSGVLEGVEGNQLAVAYPGGQGVDHVDTLDCMAGIFAFDVDYDRPVSILITDLACRGLSTGRFIPLMTVPGEHAIISGSLDNFTITGSQFYQDQADYESVAKTLGNNAALKQEAAFAFIQSHPSSLFSATLIGDCGDAASDALAMLSEDVKTGVMKPIVDVQMKVVQARQLKETAASRIRPGAEAPDFSLPTPDGWPLSFASLTGDKYVLLDFWGSWCHNCIEGLPRMQQLYARHGDRLEILSIDCDETEAQWRAALIRYDMPWKHVINAGDVDASALYGVTGYPTKILVDPQGRIEIIFLGEGGALYRYLDDLFR